MEAKIWQDNCKYLKNLSDGNSVFFKHAEMKASYIYELNGWDLKTTDDKCLINKRLCYIVNDLLNIQLN